MIEMQLFELPTGDTGLRRAGWIRHLTEIRTIERLTEPGWWTATVPVGTPGADKVTQGTVVFIDGYYGIVEAINAPVNSSGRHIELSGYDLKGLVRRRVAHPNTVGYAQYTGPTESIIKDLISDNLGPAAASYRRMPGVMCAASQGRGLAADHWRGRYDQLEVVLADLCTAAGIGYTARPDMMTGCIVFDVIEGTDRSAEQSDRARVILDVSRRTLLESGYSFSETDSKNVLYVTAAGWDYAEDALTQAYARGGDNPTGFGRREGASEVVVSGVDGAEKYSEMQRLANISLEDFRETESMTGRTAQSGLYQCGRDYDLGDRVTLQDRDLGVVMHAPVTEIERSYSENGITTSVTFGHATPNVFGRISRLTRR